MILFTRELLRSRCLCSSRRCPALLSSLSFPFLSFSAEANPSLKFPFIFDYLISTVGISPERAIKLSQSLPHIKSPSRPDAVLRFLKESGFSDAAIRNIVSKNVKVLTANVDSTLKPNLKAVNEFGFSESELLHLASRNPDFLLYRDIKAKIKFWMSILGSKGKVLKAFLRGRHILSSNVDKNILPKVRFLGDCGISNDHIAYIINSNPCIISLSFDSIKSTIKRTEELGLIHGSTAFCCVFISLCQISRATTESKLGLLESFGWSEAEITSVIQKAPYLLRASEKAIKDRMEFLVQRTGCKSSYVMLHPRLLVFSLERRLTPRYHIVQILKSKGLLQRKFSLNSFMVISEKMFVGKFVMPHLEKIPKLHKVYLAACVGNLSL